jgi:hypothetical protein
MELEKSMLFNPYNLGDSVKSRYKYKSSPYCFFVGIKMLSYVYPQAVFPDNGFSFA